MDQHINWVIVFQSINKIEAEIVRSNLEHLGIAAVIVNKQDSSYLSILPGKVEVHVPEHQQSIALDFLNNNEH